MQDPLDAGGIAGDVAEGRRNLVYGLHAVAAVIERAPERLLELWMAEPRQDARARALRERAQAAGLRVQTVPAEALAKLAGEEVAHQGAVAAVRPRKPWDEHDLAAALSEIDRPLILVLDGVTDPHNLGACLRTADAAGVHALVIPKDRSATLDGVARKVAAGAAEFVPVAAVTNLARALEKLKERGVWLVGADGEAEQTIYAADLDRPLALVMGAEGAGMRRLTRELCDFVVRIPMSGQVQSLNVSVAAGIALFEARRQRL
ncbi:MAG: 23S rRNA (guanosine(2251)-2'-O)-methyltransferase RlmB [Steroidobacteraceae bacterium]|jgi:23S rRNA (guanosine2251-2'-O)-methyltransferase